MNSWTEIKNGSNGLPFVAKYKDSRVSLFISELSANDKTAVAYDETMVNILEKGFGIERRNLRFKVSEDYWDNLKYTEFEETKGGKAIFDAGASRTYQIHFCVFDYNGKRYYAGFMRLMNEGYTAESYYERWIGGGGAGDEQLRELIFAITKESERKALPGGPPPPAPMPLSGGPPPARKPAMN